MPRLTSTCDAAWHLQERDTKRKQIEVLRYASASASSGPVALPAKPSAGGSEAAEVEEERQRTQRKARLRQARSKRVASTMLEAQSAMEQLSIMLHAATATTGMPIQHGRENVYSALRPNAAKSPTSSGPLKVSDLNADSTAMLAGSHVVDAGSKGADAARARGVCDAFSSSTSASPLRAGAGSPGGSTAAIFSPAKAKEVGMSSRQQLAVSALAAPFEHCITLFDQLLKASPDALAAAVAATPATPAEEAEAALASADVTEGGEGEGGEGEGGEPSAAAPPAKSAVLVSATSASLFAADGLETEIALAPQLLAHGGGAPFDRLIPVVSTEGGEEEEKEEEIAEEDDGVEVEAIPDRESLKRRAQRIVQKRARTGRGRKTGRGGDDDD